MRGKTEMGVDRIELDGRSLTAAALARIAAGARVSLSTAALDRMAASRAVIEDAVARRAPVYGVTTGLGPKVVDALPEAELEVFALRTVRGRAHSAGPDLPEEVCRAALAVRLNTFLIGAAGVRSASRPLPSWPSAASWSSSRSASSRSGTARWRRCGSCRRA